MFGLVCLGINKRWLEGKLVARSPQLGGWNGGQHIAASHDLDVLLV